MEILIIALFPFTWYLYHRIMKKIEHESVLLYNKMNEVEHAVFDVNDQIEDDDSLLELLEENKKTL